MLNDDRESRYSEETLQFLRPRGEFSQAMACYGHSESGKSWLKRATLIAKAKLYNAKATKSKEPKEVITVSENLGQRPVGGYKTEWCNMKAVEEHATVSYEEMCETIQKRLENHDKVAKQQLRVKEASEKVNRRTLRRKAKAAALYANNQGLIESNNTSTPGICSMGGIGRPQGNHRTRNVATHDSGHFKLKHQSNLSQSFAADLQKDTKSELLTNTKTEKDTTSQTEQTQKSWIKAIREIGRPKMKCYPMLEETGQAETDSEDENSTNEDLADSEDSTDCEHAEPEIKEKGKNPHSKEAKRERHRKHKPKEDMDQSSQSSALV